MANQDKQRNTLVGKFHRNWDTYIIPIRPVKSLLKSSVALFKPPSKNDLDKDAPQEAAAEDEQRAPVKVTHAVTIPVSVDPPHEPSTKLEMEVDLSSSLNIRSRLAAVQPASSQKLITDPAEWSEACRVAVDTAVRIVSSLQLNESEAQMYIDQAFNLTILERNKLWESAKRSQNPERKISCKVVGAQGLSFKDPNIKPDLQCQLSLLPRRYYERVTVGTRPMEEWQREKLVTEVLKTTVKQATLEPQWGEQFEFTTLDPNEELVMVELWDMSTETRTDPRAGTGKMKGLMTASAIKKGPELIGRGSCPVSSLSSSGETKTLPLYSSTKKQQGSLILHLVVKGKAEEKTQPSDKLNQHHLLLRALVAHESHVAAQKSGEEGCKTCWNALLSPVAEVLVHRHAVYSGIDELQRAAVQLSVMFDYHLTFALELSAIVSLLDQIGKHQALLPRKMKPGTEPEWVVQLFKQLEAILTDIIEVLYNHVILLDAQTGSGIEEVKANLLMLKKLYAFESFVSKLPADRKLYRNVVANAVEAAVDQWFKFLTMKMLTPFSSSMSNRTSTLKAVCNLVQHCLDELKRVQGTVVPLFQIMEVDYLTHFLVPLDKPLQDLVTSHLQFALHDDDIVNNQELFGLAFELYLTLQEISIVAKETTGRVLQVLLYKVWFKHLVTSWLKMALNKCKERIASAVKEDQVVNVADKITYSSSLVDTLTFLNQMVAFWRDLDWPNPEESYGFVITLIKHITDAALYYVDLINSRLPSQQHMDEGEDYSVTVQLCVMLNNMQHTQDKLLSTQAKRSGAEQQGEQQQNLFDELQLDKIFEWLQKEKGIGLQAQKVVTDIMTSAADDIRNRIYGITERLSQRFVPAVARIVAKIMEADQKAITEDLLQPLDTYLNTNLQTLSSNLLFSVFKVLLKHIWVATIGVLGDTVSRVPKTTSSKYLIQRLCDSLKLLRVFFHAGGEGLSDKDLEPKQYKTILGELEVKRLNSDDLIVKCCADMVEQQTKAASQPEHKLGTLSLSVCYLTQKGVVEVTVGRAFNLPGTGKKGTLDPLVEVSLLPVLYFPESCRKSYKTHAQKQTANPTFGQEFFLPSKGENMGKEGAILVLTIFDHDLIRENTFVGICVIPCKDIPQLLDEAPSVLDRTAPQRKNLTLPLFQLTDSRCFRELNLRNQVDYDHESTDFVKLLNKRYQTPTGPGVLSRLYTATKDAMYI